MKYIRKVQSIGRWDGSNAPIYKGAFCSGDILLVELKTEHNTLSIWGYDTEEEKDEVLTAIALTRDHVDKLAYVEMDDCELDRLQIPRVSEKGQSDGITNVAILNRHSNLSEIDFWRLGYVAEYLSKLAKNSSSHNTLSNKKVFLLIQKHINNGNINIDDMRPLLQESYKRMLEKYKS